VNYMKVLEVEGVVINFPSKTFKQRVQIFWEDLPPFRRILLLQTIFLGTGIFSTLGNQLVYYHGAGRSETLFPAAATFIGMCCAIFFPKEEQKDECPSHVPYVTILCMGLLEFFGCVFSLIGLNCAGSGIFQVVYASIVIWIALMSKWFLKKQLTSQQWTAVFITTFGVSLSALGSVSLSGSINGLQLVGIVLTLFSTFSYGSNYIFSEQLLSLPNPPSGNIIQTFSGIIPLSLVLIWIIFYTIPNWETLVSKHIVDTRGSILVILVTYLGLVLSAFLHSWSYYKLVKLTGSVSTGILQSLRAIFVFLLSSLFYCDNHPEQCLNTPKILSTVVVVSGVLYFTYLKKGDTAKSRKNVTINV